MYLEPYYSINNKHQVQFTRKQASDFAKGIAGDFNPLHDEDNKRFCVPGDLVFAVLLHKQGLSQKMHFEFSGMVNESSLLSLKQQDEHASLIVDARDKVCLKMTHHGEVSYDQVLIESIVKNYVAFSGMSFPHIMVPLMREQEKMINLQRPLVMYQTMSVEFDTLDLHSPSVELSDTHFEVTGKRGLVTMNFNFKQADQIVGRGCKTMVASGLIPFDEAGMQKLVFNFTERKEAFLSECSLAVA